MSFSGGTKNKKATVGNESTLYELSYQRDPFSFTVRRTPPPGAEALGRTVFDTRGTRLIFKASGGGALAPWPCLPGWLFCALPVS